MKEWGERAGEYRVREPDWRHLTNFPPHGDQTSGDLGVEGQLSTHIYLLILLQRQLKLPDSPPLAVSCLKGQDEEGEATGPICLWLSIWAV